MIAEPEKDGASDVSRQHRVYVISVNLLVTIQTASASKQTKYVQECLYLFVLIVVSL